MKVVSLRRHRLHIRKRDRRNRPIKQAMECYGLVGMASRKQLKDGITELIRKENLRRGVEVRQEEDGVHVDLYIIVSYGTKISEVAYNVQAKVKYVLQEMLGLQVGGVNVIVQGVRVTG